MVLLPARAATSLLAQFFAIVLVWLQLLLELLLGLLID